MRARTGFPILTLALVACTPHAPLPANSSANTRAAGDEKAQIAQLRADEESVLEVIAASDPRFAARVGGAKEARLHAASVRALAMGDADAGIEDGALDFFSFTARARSIAQAEAIVAAAPTLTGDANATLERELLVRLVAEEHARLDEERALPRAASALVRGMVETWGAPESRAAADTRDARIARRLDGVRDSLAAGDASRATLAELDDALDPLERIATPGDYPKTAQAMAHLRVSLGDVKGRVQEDAASDARLQAAILVHLGIRARADDRQTLERAEQKLRAEATARIARLHPDERDLAKRAEALTLAFGSCAANVNGSRLRALPPPPERTAVCGALHAVAGAADDVSRLAAVIALHDDAVVALWALALHQAHATPNHAVDEAHPFFGAQPDREARLVHFAAARPVAAIGAGLVTIALANALDTPLAADWLSRGEVPLDIAMHLVVEDAPTSSPPSAPTAPASPRP